MTTTLASAAVILLSMGVPGLAHRLDEYLQATLISVDQNRVQAQMRLTPGVAVLPIVLAAIDSNGDGVVSESEQRDYADRVACELSLTIDGSPLTPRLVVTKFPIIEEMKEGRGEIQLEFSADLPHSGGNRTLVFENDHQSRISVYLVNSLVPRDPDIRLVAQKRNETQSRFQLNYVQAGGGSGPLSMAWWSGGRGWLGTAVFFLLARLTLLRRQHNKQRTLQTPGCS